MLDVLELLLSLFDCSTAYALIIEGIEQERLWMLTRNVQPRYPTPQKAEQARLAAAGRDPLQDIPRVLYPSKEDLEAGVEEPAQKVGDYILHRSHHDTGRRFSRVRELGIDGGVSIGEQVRAANFNSPSRIIEHSGECKDYCSP